MRITEKTKYFEIDAIVKLLSDEEKAKIKTAAEEKFGKMYDLEFSQFWDCAHGRFEHLGDLKDPTVLQVFWIMRFQDFVKEFTEALNKLSLKLTSDEQAASQGLLKVSFFEGVLVFTQQWFGLKSYKEAEKITLGEILIAKRAQYNRDLFHRKLTNIQINKAKNKRK